MVNVESVEDPRPVGDAIESEEGLIVKSYSSFQYFGMRFRLEDFVLMAPDEEDLKPDVAIIKGISESENGSMSVMVQLLYRPEQLETADGESYSALDNRELLITNHLEEFPADTVMHRCVVHCLPDSKKLPDRNKHPGFVVFRFYDHLKKKVYKITDGDYMGSLQKEIHQRILETKLLIGLEDAQTNNDDAMETICQKCGHSGWPQSTQILAYCNNCQKVAEHKYCLDVIPKIKTEHVTWFCEDCKPKDPLKVEVNVCSKLSSKGTPTPRSAVYSTTKEGVAISIVDYESCQSGQPLGVHGPLSRAIDQTHNDGAMDIDDPERRSTPNIHPCNSFDPEASQQNTDHTKIMNSTYGVLGQKAYVLSQPIYKPVWSGCFEICVGKCGNIQGLSAHLSTKANTQVHEEARLLSKSLCLELLPKLNIWPKGFVESGPNDENIALYFFPQNESEEEYAKLVDYMIEHDLALRTRTLNADLLIFTSMELPLSIWRFEDKYYLWGVFKGR